MKSKLFIFSLFISLSCCFQAQAQFSLGAGLAYGTEVEDNGLGLQFRGLYGFGDKWRAGADFIYYLDGLDGIGIWELNLNAHYVFLNEDKFSVHALAGFNTVGVTYDFGNEKETESESGLNLGVGGLLKLTEKIGLLGELKYNIASDIDQLVIGAGVLFTLGGK